jgi:hypothetical protein
MTGNTCAYSTEVSTTITTDRSASLSANWPMPYGARSCELPTMSRRLPGGTGRLSPCRFMALT